MAMTIRPQVHGKVMWSSWWETSRLCFAPRLTTHANALGLTARLCQTKDAKEAVETGNEDDEDPDALDQVLQLLLDQQANELVNFSALYVLLACV
jgi:hypothetical protein